VNIPAAQAWRILEAAERICSADVVSDAIVRLAQEISAEMRDGCPVVLGVMRGSVFFSGQLLPLLRFPLEFDYLDVTRYGGATAGGAITWKVTPGTPVAGRAVLVLDDILDEGRTLATIRARLLEQGATEVLLAAFALKERGQAAAISADFVGVKVPDRFVFGFGMDVAGAWRNLPSIRALRETQD